MCLFERPDVGSLLAARAAKWGTFGGTYSYCPNMGVSPVGYFNEPSHSSDRTPLCDCEYPT